MNCAFPLSVVVKKSSLPPNCKIKKPNYDEDLASRSLHLVRGQGHRDQKLAKRIQQDDFVNDEDTANVHDHRRTCRRIHRFQ